MLESFATELEKLANTATKNVPQVGLGMTLPSGNSGAGVRTSSARGLGIKHQPPMPRPPRGMSSKAVKTPSTGRLGTKIDPARGIKTVPTPLRGDTLVRA